MVKDVEIRIGRVKLRRGAPGSTSARTGMAPSGRLRPNFICKSQGGGNGAPGQRKSRGEGENPLFSIYIPYYYSSRVVLAGRLICKSYNRANYQVNMAILYGRGIVMREGCQGGGASERVWGRPARANETESLH